MYAVIFYIAVVETTTFSTPTSTNPALATSTTTSILVSLESSRYMLYCLNYIHTLYLASYLFPRSGAHNPKGRSVELEIPPVVEWHLQENSIYGIPSSYAWLVYY